jgi:hypothetical protein
MSHYDVVGSIMLLVCLAYAELKPSVLKTPAYWRCQAIGGMCLAMHLAAQNEWPIMALEIVWTLVSLRGWWRRR